MEATLVTSDDDDDKKPMDTSDEGKSQLNFNITDAIRKRVRENCAKTLDGSDHESNELNCHQQLSDLSQLLLHQSADPNNNDSIDIKCNNSPVLLRSHQMHQLLQQHVFTPHQLQQIISQQQQHLKHPLDAVPTMASSKESLYHFEQKRKQMEILMHQIQEQMHANILQQTHLLQSQSQASTVPGESANSKKSNTFQLQKLAIQQQELAQQFQLVQRQYLLHQSGMQLLFPQHHQQMQSEFID